MINRESSIQLMFSCVYCTGTGIELQLPEVPATVLQRVKGSYRYRTVSGGVRQCHVINSRIMRANKAKECNYGGWAGFLLNLNLPFQRFAMLLGSRERFIRESK